MRLVLLAVFLAVCSACSARHPSSPGESASSRSAEPDAAAVLARMNARYASAQTYRDDGTYRDAFRDLDGKLTGARTGRFRTRWRAPDRMLFELEEDDLHDRPTNKIAVWTPPGQRPREMLIGRVVERESLDAALFATQGVSHGVTSLVPRWLWDHGNRHELAYRYVARARCGDAECFEIEAPREDGRGRISLFIDTTTYALRRFAAHKQLGDGASAFVADDEIVLTPIFDEPLPDYELAFDPVMVSWSRDRSAD
jgi:hypothetical protein